VPTQVLSIMAVGVRRTASMITSQSERSGGTQAVWSVRHSGTSVEVLFKEVREGMKSGMASWEMTVEVEVEGETL